MLMRYAGEYPISKRINFGFRLMMPIASSGCFDTQVESVFPDACTN